MAETFNFCPNSLVVENLPPEPLQGVSLNGWNFASKPAVPYQKKFKVTLYGLRWFLNNSTQLYDSTTQPTINARALELFYERNGVWNPFTWLHPHLGTITARFSTPVTVPAGMMNSGGLIEKVELQMVHHNPGYS